MKHLSVLFLASVVSVLGARAHAAPMPEISKAAFKGDVAELRALVAKGVNPNLTEAGTTPLIEACQKASKATPETIRTLVELGADVNLAGPYGATPLHICARKGDLKMVEMLVESGAKLDSAQKLTSARPLAFAALDNRNDVIRYFVSKGAEINHQDNQGESALMAALRIGHHNALPTVQLLVELGADIQAKNRKGETVLYHAVKGMQADSKKFLISKGALDPKVNPVASPSPVASEAALPVTTPVPSPSPVVSPAAVACNSAQLASMAERKKAIETLCVKVGSIQATESCIVLKREFEREFSPCPGFVAPVGI